LKKDTLADNAKISTINYVGVGDIQMLTVNKKKKKLLEM